MTSLKLSSLQSTVIALHIPCTRSPQAASPHLAGSAASPSACPSRWSIHYCHLWEAFRHSRCVVSPARHPFQIQTFTRVSIKAIDLSYDNKKLTAAKQSFWEKPSEYILACSWGEKTWLISFSPPIWGRRTNEQIRAACATQWEADSGRGSRLRGLDLRKDSRKKVLRT